MKIFFTSDWHIGHYNSLAFDQAPFQDIEHKTEELVINYNNTVPEDGVCYFIGDMAMKTDLIEPVLSRLNGTKICILGNHDKNASAMYKVGFSVVLYGAVLYIANQRVTLSHCPLIGVYREDTTGMNRSVPGENWHGEGRNQRFSFVNEGQYHLHGHIHSGSHNEKKTTTSQQWDVGVPGNNYRPVSWSKIESWIMSREAAKGRIYSL